jgi:hypothetical protein
METGGLRNDMDEVVRRLAFGQMRTGELPAVVSVWDLKEAYGELRCNTKNEGVEWGGCVWADPQRLRMRHQIRGLPDRVDPECACPDL